MPLGARGGIPDGFHFTLLDPDWDHFEQLMEQALARVPALETAGVKQLINGPESFTPDGNFILGEAPELEGFYVGCGFNAFGIAAGGGAGRALAAWIAAGAPPVDLWPVDIRRFGAPHGDDGFGARAHPRALRQALHDRLAGRGACAAAGRCAARRSTGACARRAPSSARSSAGSAPTGSRAPASISHRIVYGFGRPNWFEAVGAEHRACRERVALFDATSFAKFLAVGRDAPQALAWICANDVGQPPGKVVYTQMLNAQGGIECDLTVTRLAEDAFYIVTGTGFATHDLSWILRNVPPGMDVRLLDVTSGFAVLPLMGPQARALLQQATADDVSNEALPFGSWREIRIAGAPVRALRLTYVGELGFELHVPTEYALAVYDALVAAGAPFGLAHAGYRAIESLRLEKGYRAWGADIGPDHTPLEAGLGFALKLGRDQPFLGREALERQRQGGLKKRLAGFTVDEPEVVLLGRETIYRDGERVGWLTSGGYGYTVAKAIGYGYVRNPAGVDLDYLRSGSYELEVATERVPASLHLRPLYDPDMIRVHG